MISRPRLNRKFRRSLLRSDNNPELLQLPTASPTVAALRRLRMQRNMSLDEVVSTATPPHIRKATRASSLHTTMGTFGRTISASSISSSGFE